MFWSQINFLLLVELLPTFLRKPTFIVLLKCFLQQMDKLFNETLYKMQHDGRTIYLEKVLNEHFAVAGYNTQDHEGTKTIYIDDVPALEKLYIFQDDEAEVSFLEDVDSVDDVFLDADHEGNISFSWIIFIPDVYVFDEDKVRALVDSYRYYGRKYIIQTYVL